MRRYTTDALQRIEKDLLLIFKLGRIGYVRPGSAGAFHLSGAWRNNAVRGRFDDFEWYGPINAFLSSRNAYQNAFARQHVGNERGLAGPQPCEALAAVDEFLDPRLQDRSPLDHPSIFLTASLSAEESADFTIYASDAQLAKSCLYSS